MSDETHDQHVENSKKRLYGLVFAIILALLLVLIGGSGFGLNFLGYISNFIKGEGMSVIVLPILLLVGAVVLMVTLGFLAAIFATLGLATDKKALALPDGSIRALIALLLIVMFSILSIFLYQQLKYDIGRAETVYYCRNTDKELEEVLGFIPREELVRIEFDHSNRRYCVDYSYMVVRRIEPEENLESKRFAQQVLTTVSTLVVSVASFYFGSRAVAQASDIAQQSAQGAAEERRFDAVFEAVQKTQHEAGAAKKQAETINKELEEARKILKNKEEARDAADKDIEEARIPSALADQAESELETTKDNYLKANREYDEASDTEKIAMEKNFNKTKIEFEKAKEILKDAREEAAKAKDKLQDAIDKATEAQKEVNYAEAEVKRLETATAEAQKAVQQAEEKQAFLQQLTLPPTEDNPKK